GHRMLLNPHQISQSNCPSITIGVEHLADNFPNKTADNSGYQLHWKPCPISEDDFAKKLARRHDCHLVLSCATLKRMLLDRVCEAGWEMPALMEEPHDKFDAGNGQWLLCIDSTLPHFNAAGVSAADIQAKLAQMRARLKFTKANKSQKQIKKQQQEQPAEKRQKNHNATDSSNDEDAGPETSSAATAAAVNSSSKRPSSDLQRIADRSPSTATTPCHLRVQLERQPYFGCETPSPLQSCRDWLACLATGGDTPLLRTRCNVFDARVLLYEFLSPDDLAEEAAGSGLLSGGLVAFNTLANAIERLRVTVGGFPPASACCSAGHLATRPAA
uniref:NARG2_C domain-containing protein n=1 Tax=Macrostomum lignano TaxID=282301 RepID=A0A1I8F741_9PLAT